MNCKRFLVTAALLVLCAPGCAGDDTPATPSGDTTAGADVAVGPVDAGGDVAAAAPDAQIDSTAGDPDAGLDDVQADVVDDVASVDAGEPDAGGAADTATADVPAPPDLPHYALSMIHFNIQYVAGGTEGLLASFGDLLQDVEGFDEMGEAALEDQIVAESFHPILALLDAHPTWTLTIELQAAMIEVIVQRHPETYALLQKLALAGRVELVSFHYSDQLFTAGHRESMERSLAMTKAVFESAGLPLSGAVFTQEGQFGEGMAPLMKEYGYDVALLPRNLFKFFYGDVPAAPRYDMRGVDVVIGGKGITDDASGIQSTWVFFDDGEKLMTDDLDPYLSNLFVFSQASYDDFEAKLMELEAQGWKIAGIEQYRQAVIDAGIAKEPLPPVIDGSWQPGNSNNMFRWMGGAGVWGKDEQDNRVLTGVARARHALLAAEVANGGDDGPASVLIHDGWRELLLGEVSDATGWNPFIGEVTYGIEHTAAAQALADQALASLLAEPSQIDIAKGVVEPLTPAPAPGEALDVPPLVVEAQGAGWTPALAWTADPEGGALLEVTFTPQPDVAGRELQVAFPFEHDQIVYSPAMLESEVVALPLSGFAFGTVGLPLANGMIALGPDRFLIKEITSVHLACVLDKAAKTATFRDETAPNDQGPVTWRFHVLDGVTAEQARERADRLNVHPVYRP